MQEPSVRKSKLAIAAGLAIALCAGAAGFVAGRDTTTPPPVSTASPTPTPTPVPAIIPITPPAIAIERAELTRLTALAADASASGTAYPEELRTLGGRRLSIAIPFGCGGPASKDSTDALRWRYDEEAQALRIHVTMQAWQGAAWNLDTLSQGFWVPRPWSSSDRCPVQTSSGSVAGADPVTLSGQTLAIGQPVPVDTDREPPVFDAVVRLPRDKARLDAGLRVRLTGRVDVAGGQPIRCVQPGGSEQRPACLVSAQFSELIVENAATGEPISRWTVAEVNDPRR